MAQSEGFGLVQVEAMASGCPVINTDLAGSGVPWVSRHEESALTAPVGDAAALAAAARRLLEEPGLRERLASEGRVRAAAEFEQTKMGEQPGVVSESGASDTQPDAQRRPHLRWRVRLVSRRPHLRWRVRLVSRRELNKRSLVLSRERPILIVADQPWDAHGGGAVILRSLIGDQIGDGILWATPSRADGDPARGHYGLTSGSAGAGRFSMLRDTVWNAGRLADEVRQLAVQTKAAALWVVLHGATVAVAARLARDGGLPFHATVHDDPVYATALRSRRLFLFVPLVARQFRTALRAARSVDVVCDSMAARYRSKYGVESVVLHRGLADPVSPAPLYDLSRDGLRIGILGNTYAYPQLVILGRAVEQAAGQLGVRPRILICGEGSGERLKRDLAGRVEVEATGHLAEADAIARLRECAVLYLNYPFRWYHRVLRETSFPTKLSTYIFAARPLLIHAPPGTSVADLPSSDRYVNTWASMDPPDGAARLVELFSEARALHSFHGPAETIRCRYYDLATHRATLDRILEPLVGSRPFAESGTCG